MAKAQTLQRYHQHQNLDMAPAPDGDYMLAEEVLAVFPAGVAFMAVPRCDQCAHWQDEEGVSRECRVLRSPASTCGVYTLPDFGCVKFRPKGKAGE